MAILTITLPSGTVYDYDTSTTGIAGERQDLHAIQSFNILANDAADEWTLYVNTQIFIGRYTTQAQAIGALFGCFIRAGADEVGLAAAMENQIDSGMSVITEDGDNIRNTVFGNGQFGAKITNFNPSTFVGTATVTEQVNEMNLGYSGAVIATIPLTPGSGLQQHTIDAKYGSTYESSIQAAIPNLNKAVLPDIVVPSLGVNISTNGSPVVGIPFTAATTTTNYDARIPIRYEWEWHEDPTGSNTLVLSETTLTGTSSYTPTTSGYAYRVKVKCLYDLGTHAGTAVNNGGVVEDTETTSITLDSFSWIQGPEILNLSGNTYYINPQPGADYLGSLSPTFNYAWTKDGSAFGSDAFNQTLTDAGVYQADVTGQNTINGITYSSSIVTRNSITITGVQVTNIKLFEDDDPTGTEITSPLPYHTYYAYGYDGSGVLITDTNMTWSTTA